MRRSRQAGQKAEAKLSWKKERRGKGESEEDKDNDEEKEEKG
jgi:hypothetical protein